MTEWDAGDYHRQSHLQEVLAEEHLAWLALEGWERVLDVGCGDGKVTARIAEGLSTGSVVGIDPSHEMIAYAREHYEQARRPNLHFEIGDIRSFARPEAFDRVVSFNALHWVPEGELALRSIRRALVPGGLALLEFVPRGDDRCVEVILEEVRRRPRWAAFFHDFRDPFAHYSPEEYARLAQQVGLAVVRIEKEERAWDFGSREAFLGFLRTTSYDWTSRLPQRDRAAFLDETLARYQELASAPPGREFSFRFFQMECILRAD